MRDNELFVKFMGESPKYDESWNGIMPVWVKFRDLNFPKDSYNYEVHGDWIYSLQWYLFSSDEPSRFAERLAYAIKWYNSLTPTQT